MVDNKKYYSDQLSEFQYVHVQHECYSSFLMYKDFYTMKECPNVKSQEWKSVAVVCMIILLSQGYYSINAIHYEKFWMFIVSLRLKLK